MDDAAAARRMWTLFEPVHAVIYFSAEGRTAFEQAGLRGFWRGYFADRSAPLGEVRAAPRPTCRSRILSVCPSRLAVSHRANATQASLIKATTCGFTWQSAPGQPC